MSNLSPKQFATQPELSYDVHRGINTSAFPRQVDTQNLGVHWSTSSEVAEKFANKMSKYPSWQSDHARIFHGTVPMSSEETNPETLRARGFAGFNHSDPLGEKEVFVKEGAPVLVHGVTKLRQSRNKNELKKRTRRYNPPREMKA